MKKSIFFLVFLFLNFNIFAQTRFSSAKEYFDELKKIDTQINTFESQKEKEIAGVTEKFSAEKIQQQQNVENLKKLTTERAAAFEERKKTEKAKIEQIYENTVKSEIAKIENKYKTLIDQEKINTQSLINELTKTEFCITAPDVVLSIGDFDVEAEPMHFPMTITSRKSELNYQYNGKLCLENEADIETEANTIIAEKETYSAIIYYIVVQNESKFNKKITKIIIQSPNNATVRTIFVDDFENNKGFSVAEEKTVTKTEVVKKKDSEIQKIWEDDFTDEALKIAGFLSLGMGGIFIGAGYPTDIKALAYTGYVFAGLGGILAIIGLCLPDGYYKTQYVSSIANDPVLKNLSFQTTGLTTSVSYKFSW